MANLKALLLSTTIAVVAFPTFSSAADYAADRIDAMEHTLVYSGVIEIYGDYSFVGSTSGTAENTFDNNGDQDSYFELGGSARVSIPFNERFSGQLDIDAETRLLDSDETDSDHYLNSVIGGVHLSYRDPSSHLLGVFGGIGSSNYIDEDSANIWFAGVEGQYYFDNATLYSQIGYFDAKDDADSDAFHNAWFVRGAARYFWDDNTLIQADAAYARGDQDSPGSNYDMEAVSWGLRLEHQYMTYPISAFVAYEGHHFDNDTCGGGDCGDFTEHAFLVGAKFAFGTMSLKHNDRYGATLDLPSIGRWAASGMELD